MPSKQRTRFGGTINLIVTEIIRKGRNLDWYAEKLLEPIPKIRERVVYEVYLPRKAYWVSALERSHPAEIQRVIEVHEQMTFEQMGFPYLCPQDMKEISEDQTMQLIVESDDTPVSLYDIAFSSKVNSVIHCT